MKTKNLFFLVACLIFSLNVKAQDDYLRVTELSQIQNGSTVILAARHDSLSTTSYYAMSNDAAGKPQGIMFTATMSDDGVTLPSDVIDKEGDYSWVVGITDGNYTFVNTDGDMIAYGSSGTDFVKNGANSMWSIVAGTSGQSTSVPNHNAFVITNTGVTNRSIAFRKYSNDVSYEKFAPYSNSATNMDGDIYFFYIDIFVKMAEVTPVVSLPKFSPEGGDFIETQNVAISCDTEDATIFYTLDGKNPTDTSMVYSFPIEVSTTTTIKAFAKKDSMISSGVVTMKYNIKTPVHVSFYDNGNLLETRTLAEGAAIGELPQPNTPEGFTFSGWSDKAIPATVSATPDMMTSASVVDEDMNLYAVYSVNGDNCTETDLSSFKQSDVAVIAVCKDEKYYAMSQLKGNNGQPMASEIMVSNGKIISAITDDIKWNISYDKGDMIIYPNADKENWLYCTSGSSNNSVRIGDNEENNIFELKTVEINDVVYSDYLYNKSTERFVGVYNDDDTFDWRAYKLTASGAFPTNIKGQTYHFFKSEGHNIYCTNIEIPQMQSITTNTTWRNVSIVNKIIIEKDAVLTIEGAVTCTNPDNLIIRNGGQLIHHNNGVMATIEREIEGYGTTNEGWYTISSPLVSNAKFSDVDGLVSGSYDMYRYDEPTSLWQNAKESSHDFNEMKVGEGYLYANENDVTLSFLGELNANNVDYFLTKTEDKMLSGFHLIGNPFAHDIYKGNNAAIDDENLVKGYYVLSNSGVWEVKMSDDKPIAPCQSILVKTMEEGKISIRKTESLPSNNESDNVIAISVADDYYSDAAYILFDDDNGLEKINHKNIDAPMIYIPFDGANYAVAPVGDRNREIPISFEAKTMNEYKISISVDDKKYDYVYLVDNYTGDVVDMLSSEEYGFVSTTDDTDRFMLKLHEINSVEEGYCSQIFVYVNNNELIIEDISERSSIQIFDVLGRPIVSVEGCLDDKCIISLEQFKSGIYMVRKVDGRSVMVQKVMVK